MALKESMQAILTYLAELQVRTSEGVEADLYARIWNNQIEYSSNSDGYVFQMPAVFLEWIKSQGGGIGLNYNSNDVTLRFHLVHVNMNTEGSLDQDLEIIDFRDLVIAHLNRQKFIHLSALIKINEYQDFNHTNVYHYIVEFASHFIDTLPDAISAAEQDSTPPLVLKLHQSVYALDSYVDEDSVSNCNTGLLDFFPRFRFSTGNFFENGTIIKLAFDASLPIASYNAIGDGYTFDDQTLEATITDVTAFENITIQVTLTNPSCASSATLEAYVDDYENLRNGNKGTQQHFTLEYNV